MTKKTPENEVQRLTLTLKAEYALNGHDQVSDFVEEASPLGELLGDTAEPLKEWREG